MRCTMKDVEFVNSILLHPSVYPHVSDDGSSEQIVLDGTTVMLSLPGVYVLSPNKYTVLIFIPQNQITFDLHTNILPEGRGRIAIEALKAAGNWMIENTTCEKVITSVPENNKQAALIARYLGFKLEGINRKSFKVGGTVYDQHSYGITKEEWICQ